MVTTTTTPATTTGVSVDGLDLVIVVPPARLLRVLVASLDVERVVRGSLLERKKSLDETARNNQCNGLGQRPTNLEVVDSTPAECWALIRSLNHYLR